MSMLQEYRDDSSVPRRLLSVKDHQKTPVTSTTAAHKYDDGKDLSADRPPSVKTVLPNMPNEANSDAAADICVKSEESSPYTYFPPREIDSSSRSSYVVAAAEKPELQQSSLPQKSDALLSDYNSKVTLGPYTNNRFDRNEAWDIPMETRVITHRSCVPNQTLSPSKRHSDRPSVIHHKKRTVEHYKFTMASLTTSTSLQQDIRDGFDEKETFLSSKQQSAKRRRRSPPPLGIGSLSVTVGPKPTTPHKVTKKRVIRQNFLVDPDLDPDNNRTNGQPEKAHPEADISRTLNLAEQPTHHIIPSIETATIYHDVENRAVLPPLRIHDSIRRIGDRRQDFDNLHTSPSLLGSNRRIAASSSCGSYSRPGTTDSNAFEVFSADAPQFWSSSISRAPSETNQPSDSRENRSSNDDDTECRPGADTYFSNTVARDSATDQFAWRRNKSHSCNSLLSLKSNRRIHAYGEAQTASSPTIESWQSVQGRSTTWKSALEDLRPRPPEDLVRSSKKKADAMGVMCPSRL